MKSNFGLGAFGLDTIEYPDYQKSQPAFAEVDFLTKERLRIKREKLEQIKRYYDEHPDAILPSGQFRSRAHIENGSIVMERTFRVR